MQAGSPLAQISQRTPPVAETCPERTQSAKDAGGILAGGANSRRKALASSPSGFPITFRGKAGLITAGPGPKKVSAPSHLSGVLGIVRCGS